MVERLSMLPYCVAGRLSVRAVGLFPIGPTALFPFKVLINKQKPAIKSGLFLMVNLWLRAGLSFSPSATISFPVIGFRFGLLG